MLKHIHYHEDLTLEQTNKTYCEVLQDFEKIKSNHGKNSNHLLRLPEIFHKSISEEEEKTLIELVKILIPLSMQDSVEDQTKKTKNLEETLQYKINHLEQDITKYLEKHK